LSGIRIVAGVALAVILNASRHIVTSLFPGKRGSANGVFTANSPAGFVVYLLDGPEIADGFD